MTRCRWGSLTVLCVRACLRWPKCACVMASTGSRTCKIEKYFGCRIFVQRRSIRFRLWSCYCCQTTGPGHCPSSRLVKSSIETLWKLWLHNEWVTFTKFQWRKSEPMAAQAHQPPTTSDFASTKSSSTKHTSSALMKNSLHMRACIFTNEYLIRVYWNRWNELNYVYWHFHSYNSPHSSPKAWSGEASAKRVRESALHFDRMCQQSLNV